MPRRTIEDVQAELRSIVERAEAEDRELTDDEVTEYEEREAELDGLQKRTELQKRHRARKTAATPPIETTADKADGELDRAFESYLRTGIVNQDLAELRAQEEGAPAEGGYLVPDGFRMKLVERMKRYGGIAPHVESFTTSSGNPIEWPTVDDTANVGEIVDEEGTFAAGADIVFDTATLGAYKYMSGGASNAPLKVSWELLQDSAFPVQEFLARAFAKRIGRAQSAHWINGTGSGQPKGLVHGKTTVEIADDSKGITYSDLVGFVHSVDPDYRANAKWAFNDKTLSLIRKLVDLDGRPLLQPTAAASAAGNPGGETLLGYPVVIDQAFADADLDNPLVAFGAFGDFEAGYVIRRVKDVTLVVLNELYAANGQTGFFAWARADGVPQDANAYVALGGEDGA